MTILFMLKGLPASGKTTRAKQMVELGVKRVNRDELRLMVDSGVYNKDNERLIRKIAENTLIEISGYFFVSSPLTLEHPDYISLDLHVSRWTLERSTGAFVLLPLQGVAGCNFCKFLTKKRFCCRCFP